MVFWPEEITEELFLTPEAILNNAARELEERHSRLRVTVVRSELEDRTVLGFQILNQDSRMSITLCEVHHRSDAPYPASIIPPNSDIPEYLKRKRYLPGSPGLGEVMQIQQRILSRALGPTEGRYVENPWVCATPMEFTNKLKELFRQDFVKWRLSGLLTTTKVTEVLEESEPLGDEPLDAVDDDEPGPS